MKNLSEIDKYLNESLKVGKIDGTFTGMAFVDVKRTEDGHGFNVSLEVHGSVIESDLPSDAEQQLKRCMDEIEEKIEKELPWLQ